MNGCWVAGESRARDAMVRVKKGVVGREVFGLRRVTVIGGKVGGGVLRAEFAKRRGWEEVLAAMGEW